MKVFLAKHKKQLLFWVPFVVIGFIIFPHQQDYYFETDIIKFRTGTLYPFLKIVCAVVFLMALIFFARKTKEMRLSLFPPLLVTVYAALSLFLFRGWIMDFSLLINRAAVKSVVRKAYIANFLATENDSRDSFFPYDIEEKKTVNEKTIRNLLYNPSVKRNDTLYLEMKKGLLNIPYNLQKLKE